MLTCHYLGSIIFQKLALNTGRRYITQSKEPADLPNLTPAVGGVNRGQILFNGLRHSMICLNRSKTQHINGANLKKSLRPTRPMQPYFLDVLHNYNH